MSYITIPRLVFSGNFQADVSTVNNDARHYDNASFEPRFQDKRDGEIQNGWYNPDGTGNFRLFDLQVREALAAIDADPAKDPATGLYVSAQSERSSCKIVDLDPQMQVVSTLFGLKIVLTDGENEYLSGTFMASPFRDLSNGRASPPSAVFTSVLTDLEWGALAANSPALVALRETVSTKDGKLSINLTPYNFGLNQIGELVGAIGAYREGDAHTFVSGRRLANIGDVGACTLVGDMNGDIADDVLSLDFSNSINLNPDLSVADIGTLYAGIIVLEDTVAGLGTDQAQVDTKQPNGKILQTKDIKLLGEIPYKEDGFLAIHAGIVDFPLDDEAKTLIADHPVALFRPTGPGFFDIALRETIGGLFARAENFVNRMDPPVKGSATETVRFRVTQWGKPVSGITLATKLQGVTDQNPYWGGGQPGEKDPPKAAFPQINTPPGKIQITSQFTSGSDGWANCPVCVENPGNPRSYIDGQIYTASYQVAVANASGQAPLDLIVIHARQAKEYGNPPSWSEIEPFMQQYDNLYPIMSKHMFSLADEAVLRQHATLLTLAFSRPMNDSNHMPATRDLSTCKRQAVLDWLAQYTGQPAPKAIPPQSDAAVTVTTTDTSHLPKAAPISAHALEVMLTRLEDNDHGKNPTLRNYLTAEIQRLKTGEPT